MASSKIQSPSQAASEPGQEQPFLTVETYHSLLEASQWRDAEVVTKRCRNRDDPRTLVRFRNEVDALKSGGDHRHVAKILDSDVSQLTITLQLEHGQSLDRHVDSGQISALSLSESSTIWLQMSSALAYLHSVSVIHDDVKPDNIMWCRERQHSVLVDFGAALVKMPEGYFNPSGTPNYAPPEFLDRKKSAKGDIWGLGITMLFAFGHVPLPSGEWILPFALDDGTEAREEMSSWLAEVEQFRTEMMESRPLAAAMLVSDPVTRIGSDELRRRLVNIGGDCGV